MHRIQFKINCSINVFLKNLRNYKFKIKPKLNTHRKINASTCKKKHVLALAKHVLAYASTCVLKSLITASKFKSRKKINISTFRFVKQRKIFKKQKP